LQVLLPTPAGAVVVDPAWDSTLGAGALAHPAIIAAKATIAVKLTLRAHTPIFASIIIFS
jgi:hypothetical protein